MILTYIELIKPNRSDVYTHCIWNNRYVKIDGKSVFDNYLFRNGITIISDLYETNGIKEIVYEIDEYCRCRS